LAQEQDLLGALMDHLPDAIYFKDSASRFIRINREQARRLGLEDPAQAVGKTDFDFFTGEHASEAFEDERQIIETGSPVLGKEEKETWPDGRVTWVTSTKMPLRRSCGDIVGTFGVSRDITPRKQAEAALRESERRYRLQSSLLNGIYDASPDGILAVDQHGIILSHNRRFFEIWKIDEDNRAGTDDAPVLATVTAQVKDPEGFRRRVEALYADPSLDDHSEIELNDGRTIERKSTRLRGAGGEYLGRVWFFHDISERKKLELDLRHAQKLEAVGGLAAGIAHEINTPIQFVGDNLRFLEDAFRGLHDLLAKYQQLDLAAAAAGFARALLAEVSRLAKENDIEYLTEELPKALAQSLDGVERVATIVKAMRDFAHPEQKEKQVVDLNRALASTLIVARNELKYVADVETEFGDLPSVECYPGDLNQVFLNLLINAAHAIGAVVNGTGTKGTIRVRTWREGNRVRIAVADTGCGIAEAIRDKVFQPFFTTKEVGRGTGQGMAISRSFVVDKHGGTLTFQSEVGRGSTFLIGLPVSGRGNEGGIMPGLAGEGPQESPVGCKAGR
jgi:PAS domain S-box-containing protein